MRTRLCVVALVSALLVVGTGCGEDKPTTPAAPGTQTPASGQISFEKIANDAKAIFSQATDSMKKVTDKATAEAEKGTLEGLMVKAKDLWAKFDSAKGSLSIADAAKHAPLIGQVMSAWNSLSGEKNRLLGNADIKGVLESILK